MISILISLLVYIVVLGVVYFLLDWVLKSIPGVPAPAFVILRVIFALILLIVILGLFFNTGYKTPLINLR